MAKQSVQEFREEAVAKIIVALEEGVAPWQRPYDPLDPSMMAPHNVITKMSGDKMPEGKRYTGYRGGNAMLLSVIALTQGYNDPRWVTFNQATHMKAGTFDRLTDKQYEANKKMRLDDPERIPTWSVRKGMKGTHIEKWGTFKPKDAKVAPEDVKSRLFFAPFVVFNAAQVDGIPPMPPPAIKFTDDEIFARVASIYAESGAREIVDNSPYYMPMMDVIGMPPKQAFNSEMEYWGTKLHELAHWTGHESRLNRKLVGYSNQNAESYALEELRAEMGSLFLAQQIGIPNDPSRHASYIGSWIKALKDDPAELFKASRDAGSIADYVMNFDLSLKLDGPEIEIADEDDIELPAPDLDAVPVLAPRKPSFAL